MSELLFQAELMTLMGLYVLEDKGGKEANVAAKERGGGLLVGFAAEEEDEGRKEDEETEETKFKGWLLGIGVGNKNFREIYGLYMKTGFDALSSYNIFLEIAVESGIFALLAFLGFIFVCIKDAIKIVLTSADFEKIIFVSMALISILAVMFHGFVDTVFFRPQIQFVFWTMVAVISAYKE